MAKFETAERIILNESQSLLVVSELSEQFKNDGRGDAVQDLVEDYIHEVITNDWRFMDDNILNYKGTSNNSILKNWCLLISIGCIHKRHDKSN